MSSLPESPFTSNREAADEKRKALRSRIDASLDGLAKSIDDVRASESFQAFLNVQAKFHRYSWHNTMLIAIQRPDATNVAGFQRWRELGRFVRKGERGIAIFAPCPFKRAEKRDDGTEETREGIYFKIVHVFDVAQTDGEALPSVEVPDVQAAADSLLASLERVAHSRGIAVNYAELRAGHFGTSKGGSVDIATGYATGQQAKTLAHELAHEAMHKERGLKLDRNTAELEAESVAYVVCRHFGLDVEVRASRYIALWGGDSQALRASLERIADTARGIIDAIDGLEAGKAVA